MHGQITFWSSNLENVQVGELRTKYSVAGDRILRHYVDLRHTELDLHKELSAPELSILQNKVDTLLAQWDKKYAAHVEKRDAAAGKELAENMTAEAEARRDRLRTTLRNSLSVDVAVDWELLKNYSKFERNNYPSQPKKERVSSSAPPPVQVGFFQALFGQRKKIESQYKEALAHY